MIGAAIAAAASAASSASSASSGKKGAKRAAALQAEQEEKNRQLYQQMINKYTNAVSPYTTAGSDATGAMSNLLGLNGADATGQQMNAFKNFQNSDGYQYNLDNALGAINSNAYASGLGNSGATMKALQTNASNLADQYFNQYYNDLGGLSSQGLNATESLGRVITDGTKGQADANTAEGQAQASGKLGANTAFNNGVNGVIGALANGAGTMYNLNTLNQLNTVNKQSSYGSNPFGGSGTSANDDFSVGA